MKIKHMQCTICFIIQVEEGVQGSLVTNLVTNLSPNLVTNLVITKFDTLFGDEVVTKFGEHQICHQIW